MISAIVLSASILTLPPQMTCDEIFNELEYQTYVMNHHIDYEHTEESLTSIKIVKSVFNQYLTRCDSGYSKSEKISANKDLNEIEEALIKIYNKERQDKKDTK